MTSKTPVIGSHSTSIPEVAGHNNALLVDTTSDNTIAQAMMSLIKKPKLRYSLINKGKKWAKQFTWEKTAKQTIQTYYDEVLDTFNQLNTQRISNKLKIVENDIINVPTIFIVTHVRFYPPAAGNELRLFKLIRYLKKQGFRIVVLTNPFLEKTPIDQQQLFEIHQWVDHYEEVEINKHASIKQNWSEKIKVEPELITLQNQEHSFCPDSILDRASELVNLYKPQIIIAEYIWASRIFNVAHKKSLKIIDLIDMFSRKKENVIKHGIYDPLSITKKQEKAFINRADIVMAIQKDETEAFRKLQPNCKVVITGVDFSVVSKKTDIKNDRSIVLIVASDNQLNQKCVNEFITRAWPVIKKEVPNAVLQIVGKICQSINYIQKESSVELLNYVKDIDKIYEKSTVVVNPVYAGTGLKIKSVEALGHGKPLVTYKEGVSGLLQNDENAPFLLANNQKGMIIAIVNILKDKKLQRSLEEKAKKYCRLNFSENVVYQEISEEISKKTWPIKKLRVLCLFIRFGPNSQPTALLKLKEWYVKYASNYEYDVWIIDNKLTDSFDGIDLESGFRLLSGDNKQREFSAWQKILKEQSSQISKYDLLHFATDKFDTLYTDYLKEFKLLHLFQVSKIPICLGHIDYYDKPIKIGNLTSQSWIRTCFFFMSPETAKKIGDFVSLKKVDFFFDKKGEFKKSSKISINYQHYINAWLIGNKLQGVSWHRKIESKEEFIKKSLAIINEHSFTIKMREKGIRIIDVDWAAKTKNSGFIKIGKVPNEMNQIKERTKDKIIVP